MGRFKLDSERIRKRLARIQERKLFEQEQTRDELKRPKKIINKPTNAPDIINFGFQGLRQKKG